MTNTKTLVEVAVDPGEAPVSLSYRAGTQPILAQGFNSGGRCIGNGTIGRQAPKEGTWL